VSRKIIKIEGKSLSLSNLDKNLYPSYGFTKAQIFEYYSGISKFILPHLRHRALTLKRYPEGTDQQYFYEKRCPSHRPAWVETADVMLDEGKKMTVCEVNDLPTLMWVENLASLELHVPLARTSSPHTPDCMVFDLDPGAPATSIDCCRVALILRDLMTPLKLKCFIKTSGRKGLHMLVPLNRNETTFADTKKFSKAVAELLQKNYPDLVTAKMAKDLRSGKVFINWSQNDPSKTMVCVYSLRAGEKPTASCPLAWEDLDNIKETDAPEKLRIIYEDALKRVETHGDLFSEVLERKQKLPE
jgi:bifunctional non-homologous end joining protein LigD